MSDLIRRKDVIDALELRLENDYVDATEFLTFVKQLPSAEPERKKGKWVKVNGYCTPGGDPVWKCSECGKGIHVYGIEHNSYNRDYTDGHQWVACPNCGADMSDEDIPMEYFESGGR